MQMPAGAENLRAAGACVEGASAGWTSGSPEPCTQVSPRGQVETGLADNQVGNKSSEVGEFHEGNPTKHGAPRGCAGAAAGDQPCAKAARTQGGPRCRAGLPLPGAPGSPAFRLGGAEYRTGLWA